MHAGYAETDITPAPGEQLQGYGYFLNRRATGAMDPLMARALALQSADQRAVVVQLDLLGLSKAFVAGVREQLATDLGLPGSHVLLHCTHTHSGPAAMPLFACGSPSDHFMQMLRERLLAVVEAAVADLRPAAAGGTFDTDFTRGFAHNRVGGRDLDTRVRGVRIEVTGAAPIAVISYACHPVTMGANLEYSPDYPGALLREINAYGVRALYLNGCCGDINPASRAFGWGGGATRETLAIYGRDLARAAWEGMEHLTAWEPGPLRAAVRMVPVPCAQPSPDELKQGLDTRRAALRANEQDHVTRVEVLWHQRMLQLNRAGTIHEAAEAEVQAIACGDLVFVGLSAETFTRMGQIIRASAPAHHLMIAATSNGVLGYIADRDDVEREGYASAAAPKIYGMAFPLPGAGEEWAAGGAAVVAEAIAAAAVKPKAPRKPQTKPRAAKDSKG